MIVSQAEERICINRSHYHSECDKIYTIHIGYYFKVILLDLSIRRAE